MNAYDYADGHRAEFLAQLKDFLRIPSISTTPEHAQDMRRAADWIAQQLKQIGMTMVEIFDKPHHPIICASWNGAPGAPTVLIYGHYDVQPADPLDKWESGPFDPTERNANLYARGATDDKGQLFVHFKAVEALMQATNGKLPFNVKFLIEGEEEVGSLNLDNFIFSHKDLVSADVCVISDTHLLSLDQPLIVYGLRGLVYMELGVWGPRADLHSGVYGGTVHNPLQALCEIIAALHNPDGSVAIKGFYDHVPPLSESERNAMAALPFTEEEWQSETGAPRPWGESKFSLRERIGARPTLEVHSLLGGFTGAGQKTIIPAKATAKISCRLVAEQDPHEIEQLVRAQIAALTPPTVKSELKVISHGHGSIVPIESPAMDAACAAYERGFGKKPVFLREGGSIPVVATLQKVFGMPVLLVGFGLPDDNVHSPNEKITLECFYRGITTSIALYEKLAALSPEKLKQR